MYYFFMASPSVIETYRIRISEAVLFLISISQWIQCSHSRGCVLVSVVTHKPASATLGHRS